MMNFVFQFLFDSLRTAGQHGAFGFEQRNPARALQRLGSLIDHHQVERGQTMHVAV
jgi:hypothetical protein